MKRTALAKLLVVTLAVVAITATGCRSKRPDKNITPIPGTGAGPVNADDAAARALEEEAARRALAGGDVPPVSTGPIGTDLGPIAPINPPGDTSMGNINIDTPVDENAEIWAQNTVYFDFDSSVVRSSEIYKLSEIVNQLTQSPNLGVKVEGHCDERGTEEYNRALGERRANAIRDHLIEAGVGPNQIRTLSWGEDQPADLGHDEAAWAANRRAEFILLTPKR